jgi:hypothetical protein
MNVGDIVSHAEMCVRESRMLQHGMNFRVSRDHSVILMSRRKGAPYNDEILDGGNTLIYEGHDVPKTRNIKDPKRYDQPRTTRTGKLTPNGKFERAALEFKAGHAPSELVRVYEKLKDGIWTYAGNFRLVNAWEQTSGRRTVFKFRLEVTESQSEFAAPVDTDLPHNRLIPADVKREVYKRDKGRCVKCGATDNLHFDHDYPYSKGGTSITAANIRLLCARHNLAKGGKIE